MKKLRWAQAALALAVLLTGCSGFWDKPAGGGGGGGGGGSASGVFYVMNVGTQQVVGFSFSSGSKTPTAVTNGSASPGALPLAMAIAPTGGFLYVSTGGGIFVYSISSSGALTLLNNSQAISAESANSMALDSTGTWLIESISGTGSLRAIPLSSSTGLLDSTRSVQSFNLPSTTLNQITTSPSGASANYVFVAMGSGGTEVIPFTSGSSGNPFGSGSNIRVKNSGGGDTAVAVDPTNPLLYVAETAALSGSQSGGLRVFTVSSSSLNEVSGSPYATQSTGPSAILPTGTFVYVASQGSSSSVSGFPVVSSGGVYSLGSIVNTVTAGNSTVGLARDKSGTYILAVNSGGNPDLNTYTIDSTTAGKLVAGTSIATGKDPAKASAIVAVP